MIEIFALIGGPEAIIRDLLHSLHIADDDITTFEEPAGFIGSDRNGAMISKTRGDFSMAADLTLNDFDEEALFGIFKKYGAAGLTLAVPDEQSEYPSDMLVWSEDGPQYGYLVEHEEGEFAGHQYISIYLPWKIPEHAKKRFPPPDLVT